MQETEFEYELVIAEDCSTDRTKDILLEYKNRFPEKIKLIANKKNVGLIKNFINGYKACQGKYIALIEGDDYWTDKNKLQMQIDFIERNPALSMCFTDCSVMDENEIVLRDRVPLDKRKNLTQKEILSGYCPPFLTSLIKKDLIDEFPHGIYKIINLDFFLFNLITDFGDAGYIDKNTGNYRIHEGGIWSRKSESYYLMNNLKVRLALLDYFPKHKQVLLPVVNSYYSQLLMHYAKNRSIRILPLYFRLVLTDLKFLDFNFINILAHLLRNILFLK